MSILNWRDHLTPRGRLFDANGVELEYARECDTETGRVVQIKRDVHGEFVLNAARDAVEEFESIAAAPLVFIPNQETE